MCAESGNIYPNCLVHTRTVEIGGLTQQQLIDKLQQCSILLNVYAEQLLSDARFTTSDTAYNLDTIELTVNDLGFAQGANTATLFQRASELGLALCPLELAPYLRMQYTDQREEAGNSLQHQAPLGAVTIASAKISEDDEFPKGFYLRRMNDELWLRGYCADELHVWNPSDRFIFAK